MKDLSIAVARDRSYIKLTWTDGEYEKEVVIKIENYMEFKKLKLLK